jgi:hypothetical protein
MSQLNSVIAIRCLGFYLSNPVIAHIDYGDRDSFPFIRKETGHADLTADQA